jgi:hypothetical protein
MIRITKLRRLKWLLRVEWTGEKRNIYMVWVGKPKGVRPLGKYRRRPEDNIKMDLRGIGWCGVDWINMAWDRDQWHVFVNTVINFRVP